jgi:hypothetical protein
VLLGARIDTGALDDTATHVGLASPPSAEIACSRKAIFRAPVHHSAEGRSIAGLFPLYTAKPASEPPSQFPVLVYLNG